jgi:hypothetical protein
MSSVVREVTANGDTANINVTVNGDQFSICHNTQVAFTIPSGVSLTGPSVAGSTEITVPQGYYNLSNDIWYVGDLAVSQQLLNNFEFTVDDISLKDPNDNRFLVVITLTSSCTETNTTDNVTTLVIEVVDPCTQVTLSIGVDEDATSPSSADLSIG